ncbi:hypothetical protein [Xanthomarina spongicola]|uniref:Outer membrane protein with beta-barrel domain n=1 Tax=Xanthomarina spongicola TaxID=570520 RepID=A0A316DMN6_9FLAO|nr:hypothetical protein [Xanthomarina spongicola]PWK19006.1 hypothetical protein LX78_01483 [Xanthomarina spongicola]
MKKLVFILCLLLSFMSLKAQETYTVDGETLQLKTEVDGNLDLLWNIIDGQYRYFVRTENGSIQELVNTKNPDTKKYQEQYKTTLNQLTKDYGLSAEKVNLTLASLKDYINMYNSTSDLNYSYEPRAKLKSRLGVFGGVTNQPFVNNPNNTSVPFFGAEFEIYGDSRFKRHAGYFNLRTALEADDFKYASTELGLGYRFRFINKSNFSIYGNLTFVTYTFYNQTTTYEDSTNPGSYITEDQSGSNLEAPFIFGLGSDIKITKNGYLTLAYNNLFALFIENQGNFPIDFALGFKFNL